MNEIKIKSLLLYGIWNQEEVETLPGSSWRTFLVKQDGKYFSLTYENESDQSERRAHRPTYSRKENRFKTRESRREALHEKRGQEK